MVNSSIKSKFKTGLLLFVMLLPIFSIAQGKSSVIVGSWKGSSYPDSGNYQSYSIYSFFDDGTFQVLNQDSKTNDLIQVDAGKYKIGLLGKRITLNYQKAGCWGNGDTLLILYDKKVLHRKLRIIKDRLAFSLRKPWDNLDDDKSTRIKDYKFIWYDRIKPKPKIEIPHEDNPNFTIIRK